MNARILLCDSAQTADNKLFILGGGWSITGPGPSSFGIAILVEVDWHQANRRHQWQLELLDADGNPVKLPTEEGEQPVNLGGDFEVGRPPGLPEGVHLEFPIAINFAGMPLPPGSRFVWRLSVDGHSDDHWSVRFSTRSAG